jgi:hypothetical protein
MGSVLLGIHSTKTVSSTRPQGCRQSKIREVSEKTPVVREAGVRACAGARTRMR